MKITIERNSRPEKLKNWKKKKRAISEGGILKVRVQCWHQRQLHLTENTPYRGYIGTLATAVLFGTFMAEVSHNTWSKLVQLRATHWNLTFSASLKRKKKKKPQRGRPETDTHTFWTHAAPWRTEHRCLRLPLGWWQEEHWSSSQVFFYYRIHAVNGYLIAMFKVPSGCTSTETHSGHVEDIPLARGLRPWRIRCFRMPKY